jgi:gamma-glutamylputrescine oxidase
MRAQVAIVGGGFAGLSAAYHLARERPGLDVVLVEAGAVGGEASGRNTGLLGPGAVAPVTTLVRRLGKEGAARVFGATLEAVAQALTLIRDEALACELESNGQLVVARTERQAAALRGQARAFEALGFEVPYLEPGKLRARLASDLYRGALRYPRAANLNPLRLCRELARACRERGVTVLERTPVRRVVPGRPARLELEGRELVADRVVLATNAFTPRLGFLRGRVVPLHTHIVETEPLGGRTAALGWRGREGVIEARRFFAYYRLTADDRLRLGGGAPLYRADRTDLRAGAVRAEDPGRFAGLAREIEAIFPSLRGVAVERRWSGVMGFTLDRMPVLGELAEAPGVLHAGAWCGHGIALSIASGATIADLVASRRTARTQLPWIRGTAPWLPPDPLRASGIRLYLSGLGLADRVGEALSRQPSGGLPSRPIPPASPGRLPSTSTEPALQGVRT